ncbi:MAG TPA: hypothetical protein VEQ60_04050 [Longimicrobium sp.]|nr:hypothetical protein [Longimicrobium sp.]
MLRTSHVLALLLLAAVPAGAQERITVGRSAAGELTAADSAGMDEKRYDAWEFAGQAGRFYRITLRSGDFDAYLWAGPRDEEFHDDCDPCEWDDDGAGDGDAQLVVEAEDAGPMVIRVTTYEAGEVGRYTLQVEETEAPPPDPFAEPPLPNSGGGPLRAGVTATGVLAREDPRSEDTPRGENAYYDVWTYRGTAGEALVISLASDEFDTFMRLGRRVDGRWEELARNDDGGGFLDSKIRITLPADGEYELHAGAYRERVTGAYILSVASGSETGAAASVATSTDPDDLPILAPGGSKDAELAAGDDVAEDGAFYDAYRYFASAGETATFELLSEEFDALLRIGVRENGVWREVARDDDGGRGTHSEVTMRFPAQAEYEIRAGTMGAGRTGAYSLFSMTSIHDDIAARLPATTIVPGQTRAGRLETGDGRGETGAFEDVWETTGGGRVTIDLRSGDFDPMVSVFARQPDGSWRQLASDDDGGVGHDSRLVVDLPPTGHYRIHVSAYRTHESGAYRLSVH